MNQNRYNEVLKENEEIKKLTKLIKRLSLYNTWKFDVLNYNAENYTAIFQHDVIEWIEDCIEKVNKKIDRVNKLLEKDKKNND